MEIKLIQSFSGHAPGEVLSVEEALAKTLIDAGVAEAYNLEADIKEKVASALAAKAPEKPAFAASEKLSFGAFLKAVAEGKAVSGMGETVAGYGAELVPEEYSKEILRIATAANPVLAQLTKIPMSMRTLHVPTIAGDATTGYGGVVAQWLTEGSEYQASKLSTAEVVLEAKKLTALVPVSDELLQDVPALNALMPGMVAAAIQEKLFAAVLTGTGTGEPLGIIGCPAEVAVNRASAAEVSAGDIMSMWAALHTAARATAVWVANPAVELQLLQLSFGTTVPQLLYMPPGGLSAAPYATLLGRPVYFSEQAPALGEKGDLVLFSPPFYLLGTLGDLRTAMSIHVRFIYDETLFKFTLCVDGQPWVKSAINGRSPYVVLDVPS